MYFCQLRAGPATPIKSAGCPLFGRDECVCDVDFVTEPAQYVRNSRAFKPKGTLSITICTAMLLSN